MRGWRGGSPPLDDRGQRASSIFRAVSYIARARASARAFLRNRAAWLRAKVKFSASSGAASSAPIRSATWAAWGGGRHRGQLWTSVSASKGNAPPRARARSSGASPWLAAVTRIRRWVARRGVRLAADPPPPRAAGPSGSARCGRGAPPRSSAALGRTLMPEDGEGEGLDPAPPSPTASRARRDGRAPPARWPAERCAPPSAGSHRPRLVLSASSGLSVK